jgi:hypothetical protein
MTEAILNNERCFLADDDWDPVFQSLATNDFLISDTSPIVLELLRFLARASGLFKDVTELVCKGSDQGEMPTSKLKSTIIEFGEDLICWRKRYKILFSMVTKFNVDELGMQSHWINMGVFFVCAIFGTRLLGAISGFDQRVALEKQTQEFSDQIFELVEREKKGNHELGLALALKIGIARATRATSSEWKAPVDELECEASREDRIEKWKFVHWCELFGRKTS